MNYRVSAPGFLLAVLLNGGIAPVSAHGEVSQAIAQVEAEDSDRGNTKPANPLTEVDHLAEAERFRQQGEQYLEAEQFEAAQQSFETALSRYQAAGDRVGQSNTYRYLGNLFIRQQEWPIALRYQQQALAIAEAIPSADLMSRATNNIGVIYNSQADQRTAESWFLKALWQSLDSDDLEPRQLAARNLWSLYQDQHRTGSIPIAIMASLTTIDSATLEVAALTLQMEFEARHGLNDTAFATANQAAEKLGSVASPTYLRYLSTSLVDFYASILDFDRSLSIVERGLNRARQADDAFSIGFYHLVKGSIFDKVGNYPAAIAAANDSVNLTQSLEADELNARAYLLLGSAHDSLGNHDQAKQAAEQVLAIAKKLESRELEAEGLSLLASILHSQEAYHDAIEAAERSIGIARELGIATTLASAMMNLAFIYIDLGDIEGYRQAYEVGLAELDTLELTDEQTSAIASMEPVLKSIYLFYQDQHQAAIETLLSTDYKALQPMGKSAQQFESVVNLLLAFYRGSLGQYDQAIAVAEAATNAFRVERMKGQESLGLFVLGALYRQSDQPEKALAYYQASISLSPEHYNFAGLARTYRDLGQPELAIAYYKKSINRVEAIRTNVADLNRQLERTVLQVFSDIDQLTAEDTYRELANLLLQQGRIPEAQQVLDLLKLEEVREFTHTRAGWTGDTLAYTNPEQAVIEAHGSLITLGRRILDCEAANCADLSALYDQQEALKAQYDRQVLEFTNIIQANRAEDDVFQTPETISGEAEQLLAAYAEAGETAVLIYPFVLEDKLWLVWATAGNVIGSVEVPVRQGELATAVQRFGELLNGGSLVELQATSQQLYGWIVQPLEAELAKSKVDHLIFVNDRVTRYIPMAALFDGDRFLLERYRISTVLSPAVTETEGRLGQVDESQVLGLGVTRAVAGFSPLPAVAEELTAIVRDEALGAKGIFPGRVFLDNAFTFDALRDNVTNHRVLHIATHAAFVPGRAQESFIVLGNGDRLYIPDIETIERRLRNLHLVVLSACQTALGGRAGDGTEIAGLSSYFLRTGRAETVVASLWKVNDDSTSLLMQRFYELLATGELTKAEALRQAQLSLLYNEDTATRLAATRAELGYVSSADRAASAVNSQHPYHWAPFILIGNGL